MRILLEVVGAIGLIGVLAVGVNYILTNVQIKGRRRK